MGSAPALRSADSPTLTNASNNDDYFPAAANADVSNRYDPWKNTPKRSVLFLEGKIGPVVSTLPQPLHMKLPPAVHMAQ